MAKITLAADGNITTVRKDGEFYGTIIATGTGFDYQNTAGHKGTAKSQAQAPLCPGFKLVETKPRKRAKPQ